MQGRKLGLRIINALEAVGATQGCYKIILDCSKDNIRELAPHMRPVFGDLTSAAFYEKCGFKHKEFQMVRYMADSRAPVSRL